ncbi:MAG: hypothetical protein AB7N76_03910 [Planctomycetota bacterium]
MMQDVVGLPRRPTDATEAGGSLFDLAALAGILGLALILFL